MRYEHLGADLDRLEQLRSEPDMFHAYDLAYAGHVGTAIDMFRDTTAQQGSDAVNDNARAAISGTLVRSHYFERLSANIPVLRDQLGERPFIRTYRQNILATIQLASRLEMEALQLEQDKAAHDQASHLQLAA